MGVSYTKPKDGKDWVPIAREARVYGVYIKDRGCGPFPTPSFEEDVYCNTPKSMEISKRLFKGRIVKESKDEVYLKLTEKELEILCAEIMREELV